MSNILNVVSAAVQQVMTTGPRDDERATGQMEQFEQVLDGLTNDPSNSVGRLIRDTQEFLDTKRRKEADEARASAAPLQRNASRFGVEPPADRRPRNTTIAIDVPVQRSNAVALWKYDDKGLQLARVLGASSKPAVALPVSPAELASNVLSRANKEYWPYKAAGVTHFAINTVTRKCAPVIGDQLPVWEDMLVVDARNPDRIAFHYFAPTGNVLILANKAAFESSYVPRVVMAVAK